MTSENSLIKREKWMKKSKRLGEVLWNKCKINPWYLSAFLLGIVILFCRSSYAIITPQLYAEDGVWISYIYKYGFIHTLFNARIDYFVFGNILLLKSAMIINSIIYGENINNLPVLVTLVRETKN